MNEYKNICPRLPRLPIAQQPLQFPYLFHTHSTTRTPRSSAVHIMHHSTLHPTHRSRNHILNHKVCILQPSARRPRLPEMPTSLRDPRSLTTQSRLLRPSFANRNRRPTPTASAPKAIVKAFTMSIRPSTRSSSRRRSSQSTSIEPGALKHKRYVSRQSY